MTSLIYRSTVQSERWNTCDNHMSGACPLAGYHSANQVVCSYQSHSPVRCIPVGNGRGRSQAGPRRYHRVYRALRDTHPHLTTHTHTHTQMSQKTVMYKNHHYGSYTYTHTFRNTTMYMHMNTYIHTYIHTHTHTHTHTLFFEQNTDACSLARLPLVPAGL